MPHNNYFQFKQFKVLQNHAAMRVGTDGVMLGAWTNVSQASNILDIGTGTGIVALMLAQRNTLAQIDAIEIDSGAIHDASQNFNNSPWKERLELHHTSIQDYSTIEDKKYDLIVCNPPFFNQSLQPTKTSKAVARHTCKLSFEDLIKAVSILLAPEGIFCVVLPSNNREQFRSIAAFAGLFPLETTHVKPNPHKAVKRVLMAFKRHVKQETENELTLESETRHIYSKVYSKMVEDFYL